MKKGLISGIREGIGRAAFARVSKKVRRASVSQKRVRKVFKELTRKWADLSFKEWALWAAYSREYARLKKRQRNGLVTSIGGGATAQSAFISLNTTLGLCGFPYLDIPPLGGRQVLPYIETDLVDCGQYEGEVRFKVWLSYSYEFECVVQVWVRKPAKGCIPYISAIVPITEKPKQIVIDRIRLRYKNHTIEKTFKSIGKTKLYIQFRVVSSNGLISAPSAIYRVEVK